MGSIQRHASFGENHFNLPNQNLNHNIHLQHVGIARPHDPLISSTRLSMSSAAGVLSGGAGVLSPLAIMYMSLLAIQFAIQPKLSRKYTSQKANRRGVILVQEVIKFGLAGIFLRSSGRQVWQAALKGWTVKSSLMVAGIPAGLYAVQNVCALSAYQNLDSVTYNVINQTKTLSAALCCYLLMGRKQTPQQIVALIMLLCSSLVIEGTVSVKSLLFGAEESPNDTVSDTKEDKKNRFTSGIVPLAVASFLSGLAGAFTQRSLQGVNGRNTNLFTMELCLYVNLRAGGGVVSNSQLGSVAAGVQAPLVATDGSSSASSLLMAAPALSAATDADADVADMYIFTMTYQPEFCFEHHSSTYPGCMKPNANFTRQLTIHGLWPQFSSGGYPQYCGSDEEARLDLTVIARLAPRLAASWPDDKNTEPQNPLHTVEFYAHEWAKHGTCTNLTQLEYFTAALDTFYLPAPRDIIASHYGKTVSVPELQAAFEVLDPDAASQGPSVVLICEGHGSVQYLKEVRVCVGQRGLGGGAIGRPGQHVTCPPPVLDGMLHETCRDDRPIQLGQFRPRTPSSTLATLPLAATDAAPASSLVEGTEVLEADLAASTDKPTIITTTAPIDDNEHRADRVKPGSQNESLMM